MIVFLKFMTISACLLLSYLIWAAGRKTFKENTADSIVWFIIYTYAVGLIYTAVMILTGG